MKALILFATAILLSTTAAAQSGSVLQLRITPERDVYRLHEPVLVRAELINVSNETVCFPAPSQDCVFAPTGSLITTGEPVSSERGRYFICHMDGRGVTGRELDNAIRNDWIKLQPGKTFTTKPTKALLELDEFGEWNVRASYDAPEGSFSREYKKLLKTAAQKAGCTLPEGTVKADPKLIKVTAGEANKN